MKNNNFENYNTPPYSNNQAGYNNYNVHSSVTKGWLIFAQVLGTVFSVIGLIVFIYYMQNIYRSLPSDDLTNTSVVSLLLAVIVYFVWRSIYTAVVIIRLANKSTDAELCANRYIISALSLGVGGFFTPFLVTSFPNITTASTIKPRYFLSKIMGLCVLVGSIILVSTYFLPLLVGVNAVSNVKLIFDTSSTMGVISIIILTLSLIAFIFGLMTTSLFLSSKNDDVNNNDSSSLVKLISTIWMAILTIELVIVILFSIIRIIGALIDLFRIEQEGSGIFMILFALLNLFVTISYVAMVIYVTKKTIVGLWSNDGVVTIERYQHNQYAQRRLYGNSAMM